MIRILTPVLAILATLAVAACTGTVSPSAGIGVNSSGVSGAVGVDTGRVSAGVTTSGSGYVAADVVQTDNMAVSVGTGGVGVSVGSGPVRVGFGTGGWGLRI